MSDVPESTLRRREHDKRKREQGLVRVGVWVPEDKKQLVKDYAAKICKGK